MRYFIAFFVLLLILLPALFYLILTSNNKNALKKIEGEIKITKLTVTPIPSSTKSAGLSKILITINTGFKITVKDSNNQIVGYQNVQEPLKDPVTGQMGNQQAKIFYYVDSPKSGNYFVLISSDTLKQYEADFYLYDKEANVKTVKEQGSVNPNLASKFEINFAGNNSVNFSVKKI